MVIIGKLLNKNNLNRKKKIKKMTKINKFVYTLANLQISLANITVLYSAIYKKNEVLQGSD